MATHTPAPASSSQLTPPRRLVLDVLHDWVTTVDHKKLGLMYIGYALVFLVIAGFQALLMRVQLSIPNNTFVSPQTFNSLFTMHGTTMVFFVGMPILFGFGNYLVPLMIGARDMAFPRLNAFSFWISASMARAARQTSDGLPTPRSPRASSHPATAPTTGPWRSSSAESAASAPRLTSSPPPSACAAPA